jgi:hypothetical protein
MNTKQRQNSIETANLVLEFFASDYFQIKMLNVKLDILRGESKNSVTKRLNNQEMYDLLMSGKEEWNGIIDYEIDLVVSRYKKMWSKVKGYIIPMKPTVHVNAKYFDNQTPEYTGINLSHEWTHTMGCRHSGKFFRESLPYYVGAWFKDWIENIRDISTPQEIEIIREIKTKEVCKRVWWKLWLGFECRTVVMKNNK